MNIAQFCNVDEYSDYYIKLIYLRSRMYDPASGRFLTKDTWVGSEITPMSYNLWLYVYGNPINGIDPSGLGWCNDSISSRTDTAEDYVNRTALGYPIRDDLNTYTAAGIGVQCFGTNINRSRLNSGRGPAQITLNQVITPYGEDINDRGFGLRCWISNEYSYIQVGWKIIGDVPLCSICKTDEELKAMDKQYKNHYQLEPIHNPNDEPSWAAEYMRRRIQQVINMCKNCSPTDKFIAAALGQNGPGLDPRDMEILSSWSPNNPFRLNRNDSIDWLGYFRERIKNNGKRGWFDTSHQISLFSNVIWELEKRGWYVPSGLDRGLISTLSNRKQP